MSALGKFSGCVKKKKSFCVRKMFLLLPCRERGQSSRIRVRHQTHSVCMVAQLGLMINPVGGADIEEKESKLTNKVGS